MLVRTNDIIAAPTGMGIDLFQTDGTPITGGDVTGGDPTEPPVPHRPRASR